MADSEVFLKVAQWFMSLNVQKSNFMPIWQGEAGVDHTTSAHGRSVAIYVKMSEYPYHFRKALLNRCGTFNKPKILWVKNKAWNPFNAESVSYRILHVSCQWYCNKIMPLLDTLGTLVTAKSAHS